MQVLRAILFMTASMACLALSDLFIKLSAQSLPPGQVMFFLSLGGTLLFMLIAALRGIPLVSPAFWHPTVMSRNLAEVLAALGMVTGIAWTPLPMVAAIMQTTPLLVTLGAALFLGERFGPRRAFGVVAALVGALVIIRPGTEVFSPAAFLPLIAATGYATFILLTRKVGHDEDPRTSLLYAALLGAIVTSVIVPFFWTVPGPKEIALMLAIGALGALGQLFLIQAVRFAEASAIAPFSYVGLLIAAIWGALVFGEYPDLATWIGGAIIVASGLYIWHRERAAP